MIKVLGKHYAMYHLVMTALLFHSFITAFFMLWGISINQLSHEIVASKFLHTVFPLVALYWWILARYPMLELVPGQLYQSTSATNMSEISSIIMAKQRQIMRLGTIKISALFGTLLLIDLSYCLSRMIPMFVECASHWNTGEHVSSICWRHASTHDDISQPSSTVNSPNTEPLDYNYPVIYYLTLLITVLQICSSVAVIYVIILSERNWLSMPAAFTKN